MPTYGGYETQQILEGSGRCLSQSLSRTNGLWSILLQMPWDAPVLRSCTTKGTRPASASRPQPPRTGSVVRLRRTGARRRDPQISAE